MVRPKAGLLVRDPVTGTPLPAEGREVPRSQYWLRRIEDRDLFQIDPSASADATE